MFQPITSYLQQRPSDPLALQFMATAEDDLPPVGTVRCIATHKYQVVHPGTPPAWCDLPSSYRKKPLLLHQYWMNLCQSLIDTFPLKYGAYILPGSNDKAHTLYDRTVGKSFIYALEEDKAISGSFHQTYRKIPCELFIQYCYDQGDGLSQQQTALVVEHMSKNISQERTAPRCLLQ